MVFSFLLRGGEPDYPRKRNYRKIVPFFVLSGRFEPERLCKSPHFQPDFSLRNFLFLLYYLKDIPKEEENMNIDIKDMIEKVVDKIKNDPALLAKFKKEPVAVVEKLIGIDLPDDQLEKAADLVKAKIDVDKVGDVLEGLGGLFGKK